MIFWIKTLLIFIGAGILYTILEEAFLFEGSDILTKGIAFGVSMFLITVSLMVSEEGYKKMRRFSR